MLGAILGGSILSDGSNAVPPPLMSLTSPPTPVREPIPTVEHSPRREEAFAFWGVETKAASMGSGIGADGVDDEEIVD